MARSPRRSPNDERKVRRASTAALADLTGAFPAIESRGETSGSGRVLDQLGFTRGRGERGGKAGSNSAPPAAPPEPDRGVAKGRTVRSRRRSSSDERKWVERRGARIGVPACLPPFSSDRIEPRGGGGGAPESAAVARDDGPRSMQAGRKIDNPAAGLIKPPRAAVRGAPTGPSAHCAQGPTRPRFSR